MDSIIFHNSSLPMFLQMQPINSRHTCKHTHISIFMQYHSKCQSTNNFCYSDCPLSYFFATKLAKRGSRTQSGARRRAIIYDDDDEDDEGQANYGYHEEIALLENYTEAKKDEILLVHALVGVEQVEVVIFKGFSSCLSYKTSSDPSTSVLPEKAVIKSIDRVRGPFDPSNIQYIQKGLTLDAFRNI